MKTILILSSLLLIACLEISDEPSPIEIENEIDETEIVDRQILKSRADTFYHADHMIVCDSSFTAELRPNLKPNLNALPKGILSSIDSIAKLAFSEEAEEPWFGGRHIREDVRNYDAEGSELKIFIAGYDYVDSEKDNESAIIYIFGAYSAQELIWTESQSDFLGEIKLNLFSLWKNGNSYKIWGESYPYFGHTKYGQFVMTGSPTYWNYRYECNEQ